MTNLPEQQRQERWVPKVLDAHLRLIPGKVDDAIRRLYDLVYETQGGRGVASQLLNDQAFIDEFTVKLATHRVELQGIEWNAQTSGVAWNEHTLVYNGVSYTVEAGSTTNKWIWWDFDEPGIYQEAGSFPDMGVDDFLIGVFSAATGEFFEFWNATPRGVDFIDTALIVDLAVTNAKIQDLAASKITAGTLAAGVIYAGDITADQIQTGTIDAGVEITLTNSDSTPTKLIWNNTGEMYAEVTTPAIFLAPTTGGSKSLILGSGSNDWLNVDILFSNTIEITRGTSFEFQIDSGGFKFFTANVATVFTDPYTLTNSALYPSSFNPSLGLDGDRFSTVYLKNDVNFQSGTSFDGVLDHTNTADRTYTFPDVTGTVILTTGTQTISGAKTFSTGVTISGANDLTFSTAGRGILSGTTSVALGASTVEAYTSSTKRASFGTGTTFSVGGTEYTVNIDESDLGSGTKKYVYLT